MSSLSLKQPVHSQNTVNQGQDHPISFKANQMGWLYVTHTLVNTTAKLEGNSDASCSILHSQLVLLQQPQLRSQQSRWCVKHPTTLYWSCSMHGRGEGIPASRSEKVHSIPKFCLDINLQRTTRDRTAVPQVRTLAAWTHRVTERASSQLSFETRSIKI